MQRQIKFRAWNSINNKWLLGYEYPKLGGFSMFGEVMAFGEYQNMLESYKIEDWDKIKLMQFTGLKDKNGKDIYEGDIVKKWMYPYGLEPTFVLYFVVYNVDGFQVVNLKKKAKRYSFMENNQFYGNPKRLNYKEWFDIEIIGNIYENPELLT